MVKRSQRKGRGSQKKRRIGMADIVKALSSKMRYRGKLFASMTTGASQATHPITLRIPTNALLPAGVVFFDTAMTTAMRATLSTSAASSFSQIFDYNSLNFRKNWIVAKIKNTALTPVYCRIYDMFAKADIAYTLAASATEDTIAELLYKDIFASMTAGIDPTLLAANIKDGSLGVYALGDNAMQLTSEGMFNVEQPLMQENWNCKKMHKVFLQPGQTFEWKIHPHNVKLTTNSDTVNERMGYKNTTYVPLVMARGDLGITSGGLAGYTVTELVLEFDYGTSMATDSVLNSGARGIQLGVAAFPAALAVVTAPGEDADVN